ncbi:ABC transporter ATP-binding protein [Paenibacillus alba]|uniref:ABC transporter ATP-binding protein n=1 Tax=Paenibacillus alba TaxID=1197127 RepID=A0ABU6G5H8_9BACL|nr:ABC transporter ATP-binding protein [Paenibacillus alba]MEC0228865.1 ABC transporter ATP-binding protein [Paenibacillus alba]
MKIKNVGKEIRGKKILKNITLEVEQGEILGLLGPNGAGKTTLFRLITNLMRPSEGNIYVNGIDANSNHVQAAHHIGAIIEVPHMYPYLTAYNNLKHFSLYSNHSPDKEKILEVLSIVGLKEAVQKKVRTFSLGMKQRLGLAQALLQNPDLILLDEPTNGMDPMGVKAFREHLHYLTKERKKTVVISSHLLNEMEFLCDRVAFMSNGEILAIESIKKEDKEKQVTKIEVDQTQLATQLLSDYTSTYDLISVEGNLLVFLVLRDNISDLLSLFIQHQIKVYGVQIQPCNLEEKFMRIMQEARA